ncbi:MAG: DNA gyrase inhibitor YacG [Alphaproteobacteria bacterium]|nr:DNA gyrase inhibitor YacG [Alphaproteobacteria bacterium]MBL6937958.1 DNA gyrase inhibitor YacG [Alphaproteobacteria bacterium]MBL7099217.1 DNA gyrase inhibitor YacG [Alphaproteobacteria bacterium]
MSQPPEAGICPVCGRLRHPKLRPFCSKRCADIDLGKWLKGEYSIPGAPVDEGDETQRPDEAPEIH